MASRDPAVSGGEVVRAFEMCGWVVVKRSPRLTILVWPGEENDYPIVVSNVKEIDQEILERLLRLAHVDPEDFWDCVDSLRREAGR